MLCRKFGVDVKNSAIDRIPEELAGKSPKEIRTELSRTRSIVHDFALAHPDCSFALGNAVLEYLDEKQQIGRASCRERV